MTLSIPDHRFGGPGLFPAPKLRQRKEERHRRASYEVVSRSLPLDPTGSYMQQLRPGRWEGAGTFGQLARPPKHFLPQGLDILFDRLAVIPLGTRGSYFEGPHTHGTSLGGVPREQKILTGHLPGVIYHPVRRFTEPLRCAGCTRSRCCRHRSAATCSRSSHTSAPGHPRQPAGHPRAHARFYMKRELD